MTASSADAARLERKHSCVSQGRSCSDLFTYAAGPGEANAVETSAIANGVRIVDPNAVIDASGAGCTVVDAHTVDCTTFADSRSLRVELGDGNDSLVSSGFFVEGHGSDGDDRLSGASLMDGGAGTDVLEGPGTAAYGDRQVAVHVDLAAGTMTAADGDTDTLIGLTGAIGGGADDELRGTDANNVLRGGRGDDTIDGRGGDDPLQGQAGKDRIDGGDGNDEIDGGPDGDVMNGGAGNDTIYGEADFDGDQWAPHRMSCGPGRDFLTAGRRDVVDGESCEHVAVGEQSYAFQPRLPMRSLSAPVGALADGIEPTYRVNCTRLPCVSARLTVGRTVVARRTLAVRKQPYRHPSVRLTQAGRALLHRRRTLRVRVRVTSDGSDAGGSFLMDLQAPRAR